MLIRKTSRQPHGATPTNSPPRIGPNAVATPPSPDQAPTAVDRSSLRKDACRMANEPGVSSAAPAPCRARIPIRTAVLGRQRAADGGDGEPQHADHEDPPPAHPIAQRAAQQQQAGQRQRVGVQRPLQAGQAAAQILADPRQRDVHHGAVEHGQTAAQHGGRQHPFPAGGCVDQRFSAWSGRVIAAHSWHRHTSSAPGGASPPSVAILRQARAAARPVGLVPCDPAASWVPAR